VPANFASKPVTIAGANGNSVKTEQAEAAVTGD
jgi:hypothetical protein